MVIPLCFEFFAFGDINEEQERCGVVVIFDRRSFYDNRSPAPVLCHDICFIYGDFTSDVAGCNVGSYFVALIFCNI